MAERIGLGCFPVDHPVYNLVSLEWYRAINRISLARMHGLLRDILGGDAGIGRSSYCATIKFRCQRYRIVLLADLDFPFSPG